MFSQTCVILSTWGLPSHNATGQADPLCRHAPLKCIHLYYFTIILNTLCAWYRSLVAPLTAMAWVRHLDSGPHVGCLSSFIDNAWWFSPQGFLPPSEGLKLFHLEPSHKANWPGQNLFWVSQNQWLYLFIMTF